MAGLRDVSIRQLRALAAVAEGGSVTAAANRLNLTQPAVTLQLRKLQALAGLPLMQRTADGMILTEAGRDMLALAERIEAAITASALSLEMMAGRSGGHVAIGAVSTAKYFVPFAMAAFSQIHPKINISLSIGNRQDMHQALRGYDIDFAIMGRAPPDVEVETHLIGENPHIIVARKDHWLAGDFGLAVADLTYETFITREQGSGTRLLMEQLFARAELEPKIGMEMDSNETIKQAVLAGLGVAFISAHTVANELDDGRLVALDVAGLPVVRQWSVIRRKDKTLLPPAQAMLDFLKDEGGRFLPRLPTKAL